MIACDIHPLNNLRVLNYLWPGNEPVKARNEWMQHWLEKGFGTFENRIRGSGSKGSFCFGTVPGLADLFLIPQVYNALRFGLAVERYPLIVGIYRNCISLEAFRQAVPENQPDAPENRKSGRANIQIA